MLLIDDLAAVAQSPGFKFILRTLARAAEEQYTDDAPIKERLLELQTLLEDGSITEEEYVEQEREVLIELARDPEPPHGDGRCNTRRSGTHGAADAGDPHPSEASQR